MKTAQHKRAIIVGIFILVGILIFISGVLVLGGKRRTFKKTITLKAIFNDVSGLLDGNNVWFSGMKVGTVKKMRFTDSARVEVEMKIEEKSKHLIRQNARAKIGSDGLIGNRIVLIYGGSYDAPEVNSGDTLFVETALSTEAMMNTLQESNRNLLVITGNFKDISERMNQGQGTIGKLLTDDAIANNLHATSTTLQHASNSIRLLGSNLAAYSAKLNTDGGLANEIATDTTFFKTLQAASLQIQEASWNAKELTQNIKEVSYNLKDSSNLAGVLFYDKEAAANLKRSTENIRVGTRKFEESMEALQHNFLLRCYFKKKQKREARERAAQTKL